MNVLDRSLRYVRLHLGLSNFKRRADLLLDRPAELVSLVCQYGGSSFRAYQIDEELANLVTDVRKLSPGTVLEIGTARGGTLFLWARLARPDATIISIDLPGGKFGGGYSKLRGIIYQRFAGKNQKLHLFRASSHEPSTYARARKVFGGRQVDFLFIDGDHSYSGVKADWEMYYPLVRPGGMVVFHDIAGNYDDTQVKQLWDSIKVDFDYREYLVDPDCKYGVGVLFNRPSSGDRRSDKGPNLASGEPK